MKKARKLSWLPTGLMLAVLAGLLFVMERNASSYVLRITRLCAINIVPALSMNLINGFTGLFSLGQAGFMAIGAYVTALCTSPAAKGAMMFMIAPQPKALASLNLPFGGALVIGGGRLPGGAALPAAAGGLAGHRPPGLFRDHSGGHCQRAAYHQRRPGAKIHPRQPGPRVLLRHGGGGPFDDAADRLQLRPGLQSHPGG